MENNILLPEKFQIVEDKNTPYALDLVMEPFQSGYGLTVGNALRRILLSSLEGSSVFAIKIKGVKHEFDTLAGIKEDMIEVIINTKSLVVKSFSNEPVILEIKKKGKGEVLASDIKANADVEILNPDLKLATITDSDTEFDMKLWVKRGYGFYPTEERKEVIDEIGVIAIDALFNPVVNANFKVEKTRVGDMVDLDKIILSLKTNGSIGPRKAVFDSLDILMKNLEIIKNNINVDDDKNVLVSSKKESKKEEKTSEKKEKAEPKTEKKVTKKAATKKEEPAVKKAKTKK